MLDTSNAYGVIYVGTNRINGKRYVGQTIKQPFDRRIYMHFWDAEKGKGSLIHRAIRKYGKGNFDFEIVWCCLNQIELDICENSFIDLFDTIQPNGYNLRQGGSRGKHSASTIQIMKDNWKNPKIRQKRIDKIRASKADPIVKKRFLEAMAQPITRQRQSYSAKAAQARPDVRKRMDDARREAKERNKTKQHQKELWANSEKKKEQSEIVKAALANRSKEDIRRQYAIIGMINKGKKCFHTPDGKIYMAFEARSLNDLPGRK